MTEVDVVLWATAYKDYTGWVAIPEAKDPRGNFVHQRGVSPVPNLYSSVGAGNGRADRPCSQGSAKTPRT